MLSLEEFNNIACLEKGQYHLDLSVLNKDLLNPILRTIETFGPSYFEVLTISCIRLNEMAETFEAKCLNQQYPPYILNSIAINVPNYIKYFLSKLNTLVSSSKVLMEMHFILIKCDTEDLINFCQIARRSQSLKLFDITGISIGNKTLQEMTYHLSYNQNIQYVYFKNCNLTNESISIFIEYVTNIRTKFGRKGLIELDLSGNNISPQSFSMVVKALNTFDAPQQTKEVDLEKENRFLKEEIMKMKEIVREVKENGKLFIVGDGAEDLIRFMKSIEDRISMLEK